MWNRCGAFADNAGEEAPDHGADDQPQPEKPHDKRGLTLNFNFAFGRKPPADHPDVQRLVKEAHRRAAESPDGTGAAEQSHEVFSLDFRDGKLRVGRETPGYERPPEGDGQTPAPRPNPLEEFGAGTAEMRRWLNLFILLLAASIPLALLVAGIASGQSSETVIWMVIFGLVIGAMITQIRR